VNMAKAVKNKCGQKVWGVCIGTAKHWGGGCKTNLKTTVRQRTQAGDKEKEATPSKSEGSGILPEKQWAWVNQKKPGGGDKGGCWLFETSNLVAAENAKKIQDKRKCDRKNREQHTIKLSIEKKKERVPLEKKLTGPSGVGCEVTEGKTTMCGLGPPSYAAGANTSN